MYKLVETPLSKYYVTDLSPQEVIQEENELETLQDQIQGLQQAMAELTILLAGGEA